MIALQATETAPAWGVETREEEIELMATESKHPNATPNLPAAMTDVSNDGGYSVVRVSGVSEASLTEVAPCVLVSLESPGIGTSRTALQIEIEVPHTNLRLQGAHEDNRFSFELDRADVAQLYRALGLAMERARLVGLLPDPAAGD